MQPEFIDVGKIIERKSPSLRKRLPKFVLNYLRRIVHEDDLNEFLRLYGHLEGIPFIAGALEFMKTDVHVVGLENIPVSGKVIVASNHPLGGPDGLELMLPVAKRREEIIFKRLLLMFHRNIVDKTVYICTIKPYLLLVE